MLKDNLYKVTGDKKVGFVKKQGAKVLVMEKQGDLVNRDRIRPGDLEEIDESAGLIIYPSTGSITDTIVEAFNAYEQKRKPRWL
jgi:hypothetical protein